MIRAGGATPVFGLVLGGDGEAVPKEHFGSDGHAEKGKVRLVNAGALEQFFEGTDGDAVEVEDFVQGRHVIGDSFEARAGADHRLLWLIGPVRVEHGAPVERMQRSKCPGFAVIGCCPS